MACNCSPKAPQQPAAPALLPGALGFVEVHHSVDGVLCLRCKHATYTFTAQQTTLYADIRDFVCVSLGRLNPESEVQESGSRMESDNPAEVENGIDNSGL